MSEQPIRLTTPLTDDDIEQLHAGDAVLLSGVIYTGRDAAHKRLIELVDEGKELPLDVQGQVMYYCGPTPAPPGQPIGSAGPTTSYRMDAYTPQLTALGLKGSIGKGPRSDQVRQALIEHKGAYFAAIGGAGALLAKAIKSAEVVAYEDLGPEAIRRLEVVEFPLHVAYDCHGGDVYAR
ncbi:MAG: Fe-S-containing hydro-lyase [Armatimonadota bacterium]